jgi:hypothetical protein
VVVTWWGYVDLNHGPLPSQVMPGGSAGPGTASYQALRWHTLAQTSLNWHRRAPFCPSKCPSGVRSLTLGAHRDAPFTKPGPAPQGGSGFTDPPRNGLTCSVSPRFTQWEHPGNRPPARFQGETGPRKGQGLGR